MQNATHIAEMGTNIRTKHATRVASHGIPETLGQEWVHKGMSCTGTVE